ncbi:MAG TPA: FAD-binding and (Fe-S)-binding domain-containing protein [Anaerolineales bacterium]
MDLQNELSRIIHPSRVLTSHLHRIAYASDASYFRLVPQAVVQPESINEIQALFQFTQQNQIPMTFRAAGTSLSGQAVTDGILVDISKHWGQFMVEKEVALIRTQPGIVGGFLNNVLRPFGRRIGPDPASIDACMVGGILANNSSGMCCGVTENAYRTVQSMTAILPNGLVLDTAAPDANEQFREGAPNIYHGLIELRRRLLDDTELTERVRRRYKMKNNNGYLLNAFVDFDTPLDMLIHLMIGSEGTLGFIAEAVLKTLPDYPRRYTGQLYFRNIQDAASAIYPLRESGARAAEIMDRASLRSVETVPGAPEIVRQLPESAAAILVEYQAQSAEQISHFQNEAERTVKALRLLHDAEFTQDPFAQAALWKLRKGIIPTVGGMRPPGTTLLTEDIVFPVPRLADGITDLQGLFEKHGYAEGVIFGHAKDGNLHFLIAQSFNSEEEIARFSRFTTDMVKLVSGKYDGALKAEHGTGRNMAPFVQTEWGENAYNIMRDLKSLFDPAGMLNPGVIINPDPQIHVTNLKSMSFVSSEVDKCIECGFCESKCPSRRLTLTPRQRIVVQREISRLKTLGSDSSQLESITDDFSYAGIDTCAVDGLCATACPVSINTGDLTRRLRAQSITPRGEQVANWLSDHFSLTETTLGIGIRLGHLAESIIGANGMRAIIETAEKITGRRLPKWNAHIAFPTKNLRDLSVLRGKKDFIYFPSCISRQLGTPKSDSHLALAETFITIANRANINLHIPQDISGTCCGMPFNSKGYSSAYRTSLHTAILKFWEWSDHGKLPIVIDTTSCAHTLRTCSNDLSSEDLALYRQMTILDSVEFIHDTLLPQLDIHAIDEDVILHPNCSAQKLGVQDKLVSIAKQCARTATVPLTLGCCGFAGDRGLLFPELTASATQRESAEVNSHHYGGYYSSNIPCELGMSEATGKDYTSIVYLVERVSRISRIATG